MGNEIEDLRTMYHTFQTIYVLLDDGDRRVLKEIGLTPSQFNLLRQLDNDDDHKLSITALSNRLLCTRSNATRMVQRLEKQKLVQTAKDASDQRRLQVTLTKQGEQMLADARIAHIASIHRRLGTLDEQKRAQISTLITEVAALLEADISSTQ